MIDPNRPPRPDPHEPLGYDVHREPVVPRSGGARTLLIAGLVVVGLLLLIALFTAGGGDPTGTAPAAIEGTEAPVGATVPEADATAPATGTPETAPAE